MKLEMKSMSIYFKDILLRLSNIFWGSLNWKRLFWMGQSVSSVAQWCLTLCNPMGCSTTGLPVHHLLPDATQTHVHWVSDAIQPSHPLSSPCCFHPQYFLASGCFPISWFFASVGKCIGVSASASVLPMNIKDWFPLGLLLESPCSVFHKELHNALWGPWEK